MNPNLFIDFLIAIAVGGLVGLEREIYQQNNERGFAGIRTYLVVALLGSVSSFLLQRGEGSIFGYLILGGIILLLISSYTVSALKGFMGLTTELSVILVFLLSWTAMFKKFQNIAIIFSVVLAVFLSMKDLLHGFARKTKEVEWNDTLKFIFMIFVILPLLPNKEFAIFGVENAFNPYSTWLMVIFVSGVSFVGYVLTKIVGNAHGIGLTGVLGGLVSSTAVAQSMAQDSKKNKKFIDAYTFAAVSATILQFFRVIFEVWVVDFSMLSIGALPVLVMALVGILFISRLIDAAEAKHNEKLNIGSPLTIKPALMFGLYYSVVTFAVHALSMLRISSLGMIAIGFVSGFADMDAVTLSVARLHKNSGLSASVAWQAIIAALVSNTIFKIAISKISGSKKYFKKVFIPFMSMIAAGVMLVIAESLFLS
jgi:uncharacterized membrane protein (DUF4010 family)